jgi:pimeloyl-ACP methyl ester carboxylesterase
MDAMKEFVPSRWLRNPHAMTIAATFWRRKFARLPASTTRLFEVEPGTQVRAECHWQENPCERATLVLLHGLEGSSDSGYMLGIAEKAWIAGFNVVRLNQRNCGGTERLTQTLYHSGLSGDIRSVIFELIERDQLPEICRRILMAAICVKMAGGWRTQGPQIQAARRRGTIVGFGGVRRRAWRAAKLYLSAPLSEAPRGVCAENKAVPWNFPRGRNAKYP